MRNVSIKWEYISLNVHGNSCLHASKNVKNKKTKTIMKKTLQVQNKSILEKIVARFSWLFLDVSVKSPEAKGCDDLCVDPLSPAPAVNTSPFREQPYGCWWHQSLIPVYCLLLTTFPWPPRLSHLRWFDLGLILLLKSYYKDTHRHRRTQLGLFSVLWRGNFFFLSRKRCYCSTCRVRVLTAHSPDEKLIGLIDIEMFCSL